MSWELEEFKRTIGSKKMIVGMIICFASLLYGGMYILDSPNISFIDAFIFAQTDNTTAVLGLIFPLLAVLPTGTSYREERSCGYYQLLQTKMTKVRYLTLKLILSALAGAMVLGVPNLCYFLLTILVKGTAITGQSNVALCFLTNLYVVNPVAYGGVLVINSAICGGIFSILGIGISAWISNKYLAMIIPFAYCIFSGMVLFYIHPWMNAICLFALNQNYTFNWMAFILYDTSLLLLGSLLLIRGVSYGNQS